MCQRLMNADTAREAQRSQLLVGVRFLPGVQRCCIEARVTRLRMCEQTFLTCVSLGVTRLEMYLWRIGRQRGTRAPSPLLC